MEVRLVQLLGSFITARGEYALLRLECAMHAPELAPAPIIDKLTDASERTLRDEWPEVERQLESAMRYGKLLAGKKRSNYREDPAFNALQRTLRELDQHARAIRWVLTVTESEDTR